jgi:hypothetical protein
MEAQVSEETFSIWCILPRLRTISAFAQNYYQSLLLRRLLQSCDAEQEQSLWLHHGRQIPALELNRVDSGRAHHDRVGG